MIGTQLRKLLPLLPLALLGLAAWMLHRELLAFHLHDVTASLRALKAEQLWLALGLSAASYLLLTAYDVLALRHLGKRLPYPLVGFTSFIGYAFGHNVGVSMVSGGAVRYRLYSGWGLTGVDVTQVMLFCGVTLWLGFAVLGGSALVLMPAVNLQSLPVPPLAARALGVGLLLVAGAWLLASWKVRRAFTLRQVSFSLPSPRVAAAQVLVSSLDWLMAALVLFVLLPPDAGLSLPALVGLFLIAQAVAMISHVPGGLGVFESVIVAALAPTVPAPTVLGFLLVYRVVYYLLPFVVAVLLLAGSEVYRRREKLQRGAHAVRTSFGPIVPWVAAVGCFWAGAVLLFSGATPAVSARLAFLERWLPLGVVEASHFLASLAGLALLLIARGLQQRLDAAWLATLGTLAAGALLSLVKGVDYEEAALLITLLLALAPFRREFYRRSSLLSQRFTLGWMLACVAVVAASVWMSLFSYRHLAYAHELWWQFEFKADAPRSLRALVGIASAGLLAGLARLLRPPPVEPSPPSDAALSLARPIIAHSPATAAHLALAGDKALLFNEAHTAFVMYGVEGRTWVSMGDPVGPEAEATELAWRFRELSDRNRGWTCFYQVGPDSLTRYLDMGLTLLKLGEEATVPLASFSLEGAQRSALRHTHRKLEQQGLSFELLPGEAVPEHLTELKAVSDAWLEEKHTREKGFSLGFFEPRYLTEGPLAVVKQGGAIVAFSNLWLDDAHVEVSIDLMRHLPSAPRGTMDYLFSSLMQWGRAQGFSRFNLGMAPFSGIEGRALAPLWNRLGALLFLHGERFYNFQGLRQYKEKFHPEWTPRYLALPGGLAIPRVLSNIGALIAQGLRGMVAR